ncbi:hypothetical protein ACLOJK_026579 [Asimina triloba]
MDDALTPIFWTYNGGIKSFLAMHETGFRATAAFLHRNECATVHSTNPTASEIDCVSVILIRLMILIRLGRDRIPCPNPTQIKSNRIGWAHSRISSFIKS